jgi:predicted nucleotide-binding protein
MEKSKDYDRIKFSARILRVAIERCRSMAKEGVEPRDPRLSCTKGDERWTFDNVDEFLGMYADKSVTSAALSVYWPEFNPSLYVRLDASVNYTTVAIGAPSRQNIENIFAVFEEAGEADKIPLEPMRSSLKIFIGHGGASEWMKLKAHLQDKHHLNYETGARAGHTIRDILDSMSKTSSFALLVLTGEDETADGSVRARQNVIHETGLFQGKLGFDRAIMVVEKGVELGSNFDGIQQIRFDKGRIAETFGEVLATIRREFGAI